MKAVTQYHHIQYSVPSPVTCRSLRPQIIDAAGFERFQND